MIVSTANKMDSAPGGSGVASEANEHSDDTMSEEQKLAGNEDDDDEEEEEDEDHGGGTNDEERKLLDELEGLEEAEEEEYSGPLLAEEEEEEEEEEDEEEDEEDRECRIDDGTQGQVQGHGRVEDDEEEDGVHDAGHDEDGGYGSQRDVHVDIELHGKEDHEQPQSQSQALDFLTLPPEQDEGTPEEQAEFSRELEQFFRDRKMDYRPPKFYGENLNLLKLWRTVIRLGAYDYVTANKIWRQVGETFKPPKKCTTVSWSFRVFYEKSLLDYERHILQGTGYVSGHNNNNNNLEKVESEATPNTHQNGIAQGRAKRDAAMRAMQGWHSQKILDNDEEGVVEPKDRSSMHPAKRDKDKNFKMGIMKRKNSYTPEFSFKTAKFTNGSRHHIHGESGIDDGEHHGYQSFNSIQRKPPFKPSYSKQHLRSGSYSLINGVDVRIADEGPEADWVKINVHRAGDCFEVYALVPGLLQEELRVQCEPGGLLVIIGEPEQPNNPWGVTPFKKVIKLPSPIDANQTSAVITLHGQLFVRVPYGEGHM